MRARNAPTGRHATEAEAACRPFGYLLTLDCYNCLPRLMYDVGAAYWLLDELAASLGMTKQAPPFVFASPAEFTDKVGISGWVPLIESGIQIHTLAMTRFVSLDIYCCRRIDRAVAIKVVKDCYAPMEIEINEIARGLKYGSASRGSI